MTANAQTKKIRIDCDKNVLCNEYWSRKRDMSMIYENYFFAENGKFISHHGFLTSGINSTISCKGAYQYNPSKKEIELQKMECRSVYFKRTINSYSNPKIYIKHLTDSIVTITRDEDSEEVILHRRFGVTTDQYWRKDSSSSTNSIDFDVFGQAKIKQEISYSIDKKYVCEYYIVENYLLLEIKSLTIDERYVRGTPQTFSPYLKTYLKVNIQEDFVEVENIDLSTILNGSRDWTFQNMEYQIKETEADTIVYDRYKRVKRRE